MSRKRKCPQCDGLGFGLSFGKKFAVLEEHNCHWCVLLGVMSCACWQINWRARND